MGLDADRVNWLQGQLLTAVDTVGNGRNDLASSTLTAAAFGNASGAAECHSAFGDMASEALTAAKGLKQALASDVYKLGHVIATFTLADHVSADELEAVDDRWAEVF